MSNLNNRIRNVAQSVLENEALISGLDKSTAEVLQGWGVKYATRVAEETHALDDHSAEKAMYPQLKASRRLLRALRVWLEHEKEVEPEEGEELWAKVEKYAQSLYGENISLPPSSHFAGKNSAEFINNLRNWLEGNKNEQIKKPFYKNIFKGFFKK